MDWRADAASLTVVWAFPRRSASLVLDTRPLSDQTLGMPDALKERHFVDLLLSSLRIEPTEIEDGKEKPDVRIRLAGQRIGIEVTEATPEEYVRGTRALEKSGWKGCVFPTNWQHRPNRRTTRELVVEGTDLNGDWADCSESFGRWADRIIERLSDKERAFTHPDFEKLDENWLLIADVEATQITHEPDVVEAKRFFHDLARKFKPASFFDRTFILFDQDFFIDWNHRASSVSMALPDDRVVVVA